MDSLKDLWNKLSPNVRWALAIMTVVLVWIIGGNLLNNEGEQGTATHAPKTITITARPLTPQPFTREVTIVGRSEPLTRVNLAAQTAGDVAKLLVDRGHVVNKGQVLLRLDMATRQADLAAAEARVKAAAAAAKTARNLFKEGFTAETRLAEQEATLAEARQTLARIRQDIAYTKVQAPIEGVVEERLIDVGDYVNVGTPLFELIGRDQFLIVGYAAQQDRDLIQKNQAAQATLANGQTVAGLVRFIATNAEPNTKTYRVEMLVDGDEFQIPTGMTATMALPVAEVEAYFIPHSLLVLSDTGQIGVMTVRDTSPTTVLFMPVTSLADTATGLWVEGLPPAGITLVTRGQASLASGTKVKVQMEGATDA
jgi:multidrug efflux system membrane fusion protein